MERSWNEKQLKNAVKDARSFRQVLSSLGLKEAGGNYAQIKKYVREYNLDISHFKGRGWSKGIKIIFKPRVPLDKVLVNNSDFQSYKLRNRLLKSGLKTIYCEECGWAEKTSEGYLPLELNHINGNHRDNRLSNLQILCPNCHSLKPGHRGRKKK